LKIYKTLLACFLLIGFFQTSSAQTPGSPYMSPVKNASTNGTSIITNLSCVGNSYGDLITGVPITSAWQEFTATVTSPGSYSFSCTNNGITFQASGVFSGTGNWLITLFATGTPTVSGTFTYTLNTTPSCSFTKTITDPVPTITSTTGRIWMDRNLGATRAPTSYNDYLAYGDLYQWGRNADGHEKITWTSINSGTLVNGNTTTRPGADQAATPEFITINSGNYDWRGTTQNDNLWQGVSGINNPCPTGFRLPTLAEFQAEISAYSITGRDTAFSSPFKFTLGGYRNYAFGNLANMSIAGYYWTSSASNYNCFVILASSASQTPLKRASGLSVRCIKD
jgi:uncharacterized protein (TIGR02145 family)